MWTSRMTRGPSRGDSASVPPPPTETLKRKKKAPPTEPRERKRTRGQATDKHGGEESLRQLIRAALDEELDAFVSPALDKVRGTEKSKEPDPRGALRDLVAQVQGLADVRRFVDEQLAADLGSRVRACCAASKGRMAAPAAPTRQATSQRLPLAAASVPLPSRPMPTPTAITSSQASGRSALLPFRSHSAAPCSAVRVRR
ncbi:hypothetical protein AK812_SmicGene14152 [Symbiodinium microadriaticum]|uniref:Uncharacterized protein n=1 Tax=Symbiodinium microadriaticum TaxID=2951 RepID=A0A1Q9E674_SYMMI|nr:hypothetical protein AK812_SmicGene14152 [Symbiodinium microadriaticum]